MCDSKVCNEQTPNNMSAKKIGLHVQNLYGSRSNGQHDFRAELWFLTIFYEIHLKFKVGCN